MPNNYNQHRNSIGSNNNNFSINMIYKTKSKHKNIYSRYSKKTYLFIWLIIFHNLLIFSDLYKPIHKHCNSNFKSNSYSHNLSIQTSLSYSLVMCKNNNKLAYTLNGNKSKSNNMKFMHWNKGSAHFFNKTNDIKNVINLNKPDVLNLAEANLSINDIKVSKTSCDYNLEVTKMAEKTGMSRSVLLIKKSIVYKRRLDLEDVITSTIWIEILVPKSKSILLMGGYRQWTLHDYFKVINSKSNKNQMDRWTLLIDKWDKALDEKKDTIVLIDDNIDSLFNSSHNHTFKLKHLYDKLLSLIVKQNLIVHNNKITHYSQYYPNSCIDHIYSNCANKISNSNTCMTGQSDHAMLYVIYSSVEKNSHPKFVKIKNVKLLSKNRLLSFVSNSDILNDVFNFSDPNMIANILQLELNSIINAISPFKIVQYSKNIIPYIDSKIQQNL